ncbi:MAG: ribosomal-processing cysteine protease Prp [Ruminococcus sp.]|nr:ribosomal-processing cysteine protease Prp [Ruminococcus sp.]MDE6847989.1 ribosomal-processing cysteine protease Prp [Ruminococcus sp.]
MIHAEFYKSQGLLTGFSFSGHSGYAEAGKDIVCSAVSSAVQLTANMLDEFGFAPDISVGDNVIECTLEKSCEDSSRMLNVLKAHFESVLEEFPKTIKITISEV